jgi:hypothetical protein
MAGTPPVVVARQLATVRTYAQLIAVLRARSDELEITRAITDDAACLPPGYAAKLLSRTPVKALGPNSMGAVLGVLGLALVVVEDARPVALPKRKYRRAGQATPLVRPDAAGPHVNGHGLDREPVAGTVCTPAG